MTDLNNAAQQLVEAWEPEPISQPKPNATTPRQDPGAYDRGVLTGLRQALAICSDYLREGEDFTADRLAGEIHDAINNQMALEQPDPDRWGAGYEAGYAAGMAEMKPEQAEPLAWFEPVTRRLRQNPAFQVGVSVATWHGEVPLYIHPQCQVQTGPYYIDQVRWHSATPSTLPPPDHDVLVTFEGTRGCYIAAWMGSDQGWIGVDSLPLKKVLWWAKIPPGPPPGFDAARRASQAPA